MCLHRQAGTGRQAQTSTRTCSVTHSLTRSFFFLSFSSCFSNEWSNTNFLVFVVVVVVVVVVVFVFRRIE